MQCHNKLLTVDFSVIRCVKFTLSHWITNNFVLKITFSTSWLYRPVLSRYCAFLLMIDSSGFVHWQYVSEQIGDLSFFVGQEIFDKQHNYNPCDRCCNDVFRFSDQVTTILFFVWSFPLGLQSFELSWDDASQTILFVNFNNRLTRLRVILIELRN
jgi:hypothetical protein